VFGFTHPGINATIPCSRGGQHATHKITIAIAMQQDGINKTEVSLLHNSLTLFGFPVFRLWAYTWWWLFQKRAKLYIYFFLTCIQNSRNCPDEYKL